MGPSSHVAKIGTLGWEKHVPSVREHGPRVRRGREPSHGKDSGTVSGRYSPGTAVACRRCGRGSNQLVEKRDRRLSSASYAPAAFASLNSAVTTDLQSIIFALILQRRNAAQSSGWLHQVPRPVSGGTQIRAVSTASPLATLHPDLGLERALPSGHDVPAWVSAGTISCPVRVWCGCCNTSSGLKQHAFILCWLWGSEV